MAFHSILEAWRRQGARERVPKLQGSHGLRLVRFEGFGTNSPLTAGKC